MAAKSAGYAVRANGLCLTKKGEFFALGDKTAVFETKSEGEREIVRRLGELMPGSYQADIVPVKRVWIEAQ